MLFSLVTGETFHLSAPANTKRKADGRSVCIMYTYKVHDNTQNTGMFIHQSI